MAQHPGASPADQDLTESETEGTPILESDESESEWETDTGSDAGASRGRSRASAAAAVAAEEEDGRVEDYRASEEEDEEEEGEEDEEVPPLMSDASDSDDEEGGAPPRHARGTAHAALAPLPQASVLLVCGVALGELARRFLLLLGAQGAGASSPLAAAWAAAERLRGLTEVPGTAGAARDALAVSGGRGKVLKEGAVPWNQSSHAEAT